MSKEEIVAQLQASIAKIEWDVSPWLVAAAAGDTRLMEVLAATPVWASFVPQTALDTATRYGHMEAAKFLQGLGLRTTSETLRAACELAPVATVQMLVAAEATLAKAATGASSATGTGSRAGSVAVWDEALEAAVRRGNLAVLTMVAPLAAAPAPVVSGAAAVGIQTCSQLNTPSALHAVEFMLDTLEVFPTPHLGSGGADALGVGGLSAAALAEAASSDAAGTHRRRSFGDNDGTRESNPDGAQPQRRNSHHGRQSRSLIAAAVAASSPALRPEPVVIAEGGDDAAPVAGVADGHASPTGGGPNGPLTLADFDIPPFARFSFDLLGSAVQGGGLDTVQMVAARCPGMQTSIARDAIDMAVSSGSLELVQWLHRMGCKISPLAVTWAVRKSRLNMLQWFERTVPSLVRDMFSQELLDEAVTSSTPVLEWVVERTASSIMPSISSIERAAGLGLLEQIEHLHTERRIPTLGSVSGSSATPFANSVPTPSVIAQFSRAVDSAAANGHLRVMEFFLTVLQWPYSRRAFDFSAAGNQIQVMDYLLRVQRNRGLPPAPATEFASAPVVLQARRVERMHSRDVLIDSPRTPGTPLSASSPLAPQTPTLSAAAKVSVLLQHAASMCSGFTSSAANQAAARGQIRALQYLYHNTDARVGRSGVVGACRAGHLHVLKWLDGRQENLLPSQDGTDGEGDDAGGAAASPPLVDESCLEEAAAAGSPGLVRWLMDNGIRVTPLAVKNACMRGCASTLQVIMARLVGDPPTTPLLPTRPIPPTVFATPAGAAQPFSSKRARKFKDQAGRPGLPREYRDPVFAEGLLAAVERGHVQVLQVVAHRFLDECRGVVSSSCFAKAVASNHFDVVKFCIEFELVSELPSTLMEDAARSGSVTMCRLLSSVCEGCSDGALLAAVSNNSLAVSRWLFGAYMGAAWDLNNDNLQLEEDLLDPEILEFLINSHLISIAEASRALPSHTNGRRWLEARRRRRIVEWDDIVPRVERQVTDMLRQMPERVRANFDDADQVPISSDSACTVDRCVLS